MTYTPKAPRDPRGVPLQEWFTGGRRQPDLPTSMPTWLEPLTSAVRRRPGVKVNGINRAVPEVGIDGTPPRPSAVLVLFGEDAPGSQVPTVLLTHRTPTLNSHSGQIAFPGGHREFIDPDPVATALREATEETGLDAAGVAPLAVLDPLYIDRTNHAVVPVVGWWRAPVPVSPATEESDWVRSVPVTELADPARRMYLGLPGIDVWRSPAFELDGFLLWGFTAAVVDSLLRAGGWERPWREDAPVRDLFDAVAGSRNGEMLKRGDIR